MKLFKTSKHFKRILLPFLAVGLFLLPIVVASHTKTHADTSTVKVVPNPAQPATSIVITWQHTADDDKTLKNGSYAFALLDSGGLRLGNVTYGTDNNWSGVAPIAAQTITISGLTPSTTYELQVAPFYSNGRSASGNPEDGGSVTTKAQDIQAFHVSIGTSGANSLPVSWSAISTATDYGIQYTSSTGKVGGANITAGTTSHTLVGLDQKTTYNVTVTAYIGQREITHSTASATTGTAAVTNLGVTAKPAAQGGDTQIDVRWAKIINAVRYRVDYKAGLQIGGSPSTNTGLTLSGLKSKTTYTITVTAFDSHDAPLTSMTIKQATNANGVSDTNCTPKNLNASDCATSAAICQSNGGVYTRISKDVYACQTTAVYCTATLGGKWDATKKTCTKPDPSKVCTAAGLTYNSKSQKCVGDADAATCAGLPALGGVAGACKANVPDPNQGVSAGKCGKAGSFFGLPTWYEYLKTSTDSQGNCEITKFCVLASNGCTSSSIPFVLLAVVDIGLRIGALVSLGFVVFGGFKFVTSQGEPDGVKGARNTILNALVGLVITIIAVPIVAFIGNQFGG